MLPKRFSDLLGRDTGDHAEVMGMSYVLIGVYVTQAYLSVKSFLPIHLESVYIIYTSINVCNLYLNNNLIMLLSAKKLLSS